jgi:purine-binding chemotaxis protein CheW
MFEVVYPLPLVPSYVLGVVNRYSVPYALFDIGLLFHQTQTPRNKILVFKDEIDRVAVLIDDITGIIDIDRENIYHIEKSANFDLSDAVVSSFNWNNTDIFVLDIHRILESVSREIV